MCVNTNACRGLAPVHSSVSAGPSDNREIKRSQRELILSKPGLCTTVVPFFFWLISILHELNRELKAGESTEAVFIVYTICLLLRDTQQT